MLNSYAVDKMTERQLIETARTVFWNITDDYLQGRLTKGKVRRYRELHNELMRELLIRGHQTQLDV